MPGPRKASAGISKKKRPAAAKALAEAPPTPEVEMALRHESTLASVYNLGSLYIEHGNVTRGEELLVEEYNACKEAKGARHPDTMASLENMNSLLRGAKLFEGGAPKVPGADVTNTA